MIGNMDQELCELSRHEVEKVNGAWLPNVIGALAGAIGGVYATAIGAGGNASSKTLWGAGLAGAATGFVNPISSVGRLAGTISTGAMSGATSNAVDSQYEETTDE